MTVPETNIVSPTTSKPLKASLPECLALNLRSRELTVLKLGGSAITDKTRELTPDLVTIHRSADQVANFHHPLILLHGGGSFAHPFASKAKLQDGYRTRSQLGALTETELYLEQLSRLLMVSLLQRGIPTVRVHPLSCIEASNGKVANDFLDAFKHSLRLGLLPISHGDVVFDKARGFSILSGDRLAFLLGVRFKATRVLFGSDVDGVYTGDPKTDTTTSLIKEVNRSNIGVVTRSLRQRVGRGNLRDVTGGMLGKVREASELAKKGCETIIFNLKSEGTLEAVLQRSPDDWNDQVRCTRFRAWSQRA